MDHPLVWIFLTFAVLATLVGTFVFWPYKKDAEEEQRIREQRDRK